MKNQTVGLFGKYRNPAIAETLNTVRRHLENLGARVLLGDSTATEIAGERLESTEDYQTMQFAVVVGGDGTLLHAARILARHDVPIVGINLGTLGFLTDIPNNEIFDCLTAIQQGRYSLERRSMLKTSIFRDGELVYKGHSMNDTVISKGTTGRLIEMCIHVDGVFVNKTRSDGMILATPTGSTAYAMAAGGPIVAPTTPVNVIVPICPHTLSNRPIIIDKQSVVEISQLNFRDDNATLAVDGVIKASLDGSELIRIEPSPYSVPLIRIDQHDHFEALRSKLGWSN